MLPNRIFYSKAVLHVFATLLCWNYGSCDDHVPTSQASESHMATFQQEQQGSRAVHTHSHSHIRRRVEAEPENEYEELKFSELMDLEGDQIPKRQSRIIDGTLVPDGRYKYLVALFKRDAKGYLTHMCGGSIVSPDFILTAAHCLANTHVIVTGLRDYRDVPVGSYERFDVTEKNFIQHPLYSSTTLDSDFALIRLPRPTRFPAIALNINGIVPQGKQDMTVMGWGYLRNNQAESNAYEAVLDHVDTLSCRAKWGFSVIKDSMLCATGYGKVDTCQGDSGGPMILKGANDSQDVLLGLTSWGAGCADPTFPGVYARVSSTKEWLKMQIPSLFENETPVQSSDSNNNGWNNNGSSSNGSSSNGNEVITPVTVTNEEPNTQQDPDPTCTIIENCWNILYLYRWCSEECVYV